MPAGAPGTEAGAQADQKTCRQQPMLTDGELYRRQSAEQLPDQWRHQQSENKKQSLSKTLTGTTEQTAQQATDTCHAAIQNNHQSGREANQHATGERRPGMKFTQSIIIVSPSRKNRNLKPRFGPIIQLQPSAPKYSHE